MSRQTLERLHAAIQEHSNDLCEDDSDAGVVGHALVVWEETQFGEDGEVHKMMTYATTGDGAAPSASLGLAVYGLERLKRDVIRPA